MFGFHPGSEGDPLNEDENRSGYVGPTGLVSLGHSLGCPGFCRQQSGQKGGLEPCRLLLSSTCLLVGNAPSCSASKLGA